MAVYLKISKYDQGISIRDIFIIKSEKKCNEIGISIADAYHLGSLSLLRKHQV